MEVISRASARAAGLKRYFTGKPCKRGHAVERLVANAQCVTCHWAYCRVQMRERYYKNPAPVRENVMKYYAANREKVATQHKADRTRLAAYQRARFAQNPGMNAAYVAARRAARLKATPRWLTAEDHETMRYLYEEAASFSEYSGVKFHVDHIVPLRGKTVSGLHVPWNLQVIAASKNLSKHNKYSAAG